jgi:flagellar biogenesis protein FliO
MAKKKQLTKSEARSLRAQQIVFIVISLMIIIAMVLSMITKF